MRRRPLHTLIIVITGVVIFFTFTNWSNSLRSPVALSRGTQGLNVQETDEKSQDAIQDSFALEPTRSVTAPIQTPASSESDRAEASPNSQTVDDVPTTNDSSCLRDKSGDIPNPFRIFLTEGSGSHEEVYAALIYAFAQIPNSYIYPYLLLPRFKIFDVLKSFNLHNVAKPRFSGRIKFNRQNPQPDIILASTCEYDVTELQPQMSYMLGNGSYLFCTIHHADRWHNRSSYNLYNAIKPWIEAERVTFLFLSGHTKRYTEDIVVPSWEPEHRIGANKFEVFVPVFPVEASSNMSMGLSLQGNYESARRDYRSIFEQFRNFLKNNADKQHLQKLKMHLIGHGKHPHVPEDIRDRIEFNEGLEFMEFYKILSESFAVLPAFANDEYYDRKASSSVPASLIAGVPIVGRKRLLETYDYLTEESMWLQGDHEDDMDAINRVLVMSEKDIEDRKTRTQTRNLEIIGENIRKAVSWTQNIIYLQRRTCHEPVKEGWTWEW